MSKGSSMGLLDARPDPPIPAGNYVLHLDKVEEVENENAGGWSLSVEMTITDGPVVEDPETGEELETVGRKVFDRLVYPQPSFKDQGRRAALNMREFLDAVGDVDYNNDDYDFEALEEKVANGDVEVAARMRNRRFADENRPEVRKYRPLS